MIAGVVLLAGGAAVGLFGSLLGLGGGILLVPLLTLGFGLPLREAVAIPISLDQRGVSQHSWVAAIPVCDSQLAICRRERRIDGDRFLEEWNAIVRAARVHGTRSLHVLFQCLERRRRHLIERRIGVDLLERFARLAAEAARQLVDGAE